MDVAAKPMTDHTVHRRVRRRRKVRGIEQQSTAGLHGVLPLWEHQVEHVRRTMMTSPGYRFAIIHIIGRVYRLYTNMKLTPRLLDRLTRPPRVPVNERRSGTPTPVHPAPKPASMPMSNPQNGGAIAKHGGLVAGTVAPPKKRPSDHRIAELAGQMGAKRIQKTLLAEGIDMPLTTIKRRMREVRK